VNDDLMDDNHLLQRMPTPIHEYLEQKRGDALKDGLQFIEGACSSVTIRLIDDTVSLGSAEVRFTEKWHRSPDR
jgi:hypothetical protein